MPLAERRQVTEKGMNMQNEVVGFGQGLSEVWVVVSEIEGWLLSAFQDEAKAFQEAKRLNRQHKQRTSVAKFLLDPATVRGFPSLEEEEEED